MEEKEREYGGYFVIDDSVKLTATPSQLCAICEIKNECEKYRKELDYERNNNEKENL